MSQLHVLLLEVVNTDRFRIYRSEFFPFLQSLLSAAGIRVTRAWVGVETITAAAGRNQYVYRFPEQDEGPVLRQIEALAPTHILLNERLEEDLWIRLKAHTENASVRMSTMAHGLDLAHQLSRWLEVELPLDANLLLEEQVLPNHGAVALNPLARTIRPAAPLLVGPACTYRAALSRNSYFQGLPPEVLPVEQGCSFCRCIDIRLFLPHADVVSLTVSQLKAALQTLNPELQDRLFMVRGTQLLPRIDQFAEQLLDSEFRGCSFLISSRIDELQRASAALERALPMLERAGCSLHFWNMGLENLSPEENLRLNKGLSPEAIRTGVALIRRLAADHPLTFRFDGFGFILYTPWTRLEDLRINLQAFTDLELDHPTFFLGTALQLLPEVALTELARKDGLLAEAFEDRPTDSGCLVAHDEAEVAWRFRDPRVATLYFISRRLSSSAVIPEDEPAYLRITNWFNGLPDEKRDAISVFSVLLDQAERHAPETPWEQLLQRASEFLGSGFAASPTPTKETDSPQQQQWKELASSLQGLVATVPGSSMVLTELRYRATDRGASLEAAFSAGETSWTAVVEPLSPEARFFLKKGALGLYYKSGLPQVTPAHRSVMEWFLDCVLKSLPKQARG